MGCYFINYHIVFSIYLVANLSYHTILTTDELINNKAIAMVCNVLSINSNCAFRKKKSEVVDVTFHDCNINLQLVGKRMLEKEEGDIYGKIGEIFFGISVAISTFGALSSSLMGASR